MKDDTLARADLRETLEQVATVLVLAGPGDLQELARVHGWLGEIAATPPDAVPPRLAAAALAATGLLEKVILGETDAAATLLGTVGQTVAALQSVLCEGRAFAEVALPAELGLGCGTETSGVALPGGLRHPGVLPLHVEPMIYAEFLCRQVGALEEIEATLLALEDGVRDESVVLLRRQVHTLKGEAALLGLTEVERLCHAMEDALQRGGSAELVQPLLESRDWLERMFAFCHGESERPGPCGELLAALAAAGNAVPTPALAAANAPPPAVESGTPACDGRVALAGDRSLLGEFVNEACEHLDAAEAHLLALEADPSQEDAINGIFRAFHTIKGVAGFLGLDEIGRLAHEAENLLDRARKGTLQFVGPAVDATFAAVDLMKRLVDALRAALADGQGLAAEPQLPGLLARLRAISTGESAASIADSASVVEAAAPPDRAPAPSPAVQDAGPTRATNAAGPAARLREAVKVDAERLDRLVDAIGELVIAESMVSQSLRDSAAGDGRLARQLGLLDKITRELQEMATSLRMVPIKATFQKMARLARDLSVKAGKPIEFVMAGEDTELDKTVVDRIGDPLVHMVRNAVDHGLEATVAERRRAGKPDKGRVELRAFHRGGTIFVEISDDGRGLDRAAILAKARERGLLREGEVPSDREICNLIFQPGFSTASKITEVSGRGVGMDVVRRSIESLRGTVEISTEAGRGSTFSLRLPLTLAIIDGMIVRVGGERYILPTLSIVRSVQPGRGDVSTLLGRGEMLTVGGRLLPLFRLGHLYTIRDAERDPTRALAVVIEAEGRQTALLVDELLGQQQIVIKSMGKSMQTQPSVAGAAIMPDGRVGLILDPGGLTKLACFGGAAAAATLA